MIANIKILEKYCTDYKNIENYDTAIKSPLRYDLHHRNEISEHKSKKQLITENLYYNRPPEELVFLEHGEHMRLHREGKHLSEETKKKLSDANKGKQNALGHHFNPSTETKQRMSESHKCKHRPAFSIEWKQKISAANKSKHPSAESRQKMSEARKGKHWHTENSHRIWTE
jgi:hypothetical protein